MVESTTVMVAHSPDLVQFRNVAVAYTVWVKKGLWFSDIFHKRFENF